MKKPVLALVAVLAFANSAFAIDCAKKVDELAFESVMLGQFVKADEVLPTLGAEPEQFANVRLEKARLRANVLRLKSEIKQKCLR